MIFVRKFTLLVSLKLLNEIATNRNKYNKLANNKTTRKTMGITRLILESIEFDDF